MSEVRDVAIAQDTEPGSAEGGVLPAVCVLSVLSCRSKLA
jgi:hypothetical protein